MSRPLGLALVYVVAMATPVDAQDVTAQRERVAALAARWAVLRDSLAAMDRDVRPDTVIAGRLHLLVDPAMQEHLAPAALIAWSHLEAALGKTDSELLDAWWPAVRYRGMDRWAWSRAGPGILADSARSAEALARVIEDAAWSWLLVLGGNTVVRWTSGLHPRPGRDYLRRAYLELVDRPSQATRFCYQGDLQWCAKALGLVEVADRWRELTTPADRRILLRRRRWERSDVFQQCQAGADAACLRLTDGYPLARPLSSDATTGLVIEARSLGGDGALSRLLSDSTLPLADRLEATARAPLDSLLSAWHTSVMAARPYPSRLAGATAWVTLFVTGVLATFALRSSRWRLD
ncbi:MAG TPA: hypothetical protein VGA37_11430 [Gemmatimonadales bacterium]